MNSILEMQNDLGRIITLATRNGVEKRGPIADAIAAMRKSLVLLQHDRRGTDRRKSTRGKGMDERRNAYGRRWDDR